MKGAIQKTETAQDEFLSCNFYCERRRRKPSCDKSEKLNIFILYEHFQMEVLDFLKFLLEQNDYLYKIDLKDAYSTIPLSIPLYNHPNARGSGGQATSTNFSVFVLLWV